MVLHAPAKPNRLLFTVGDYYRMAEAGILKPDDRVELIDGVIFEMAPIGSHHAGRVKRFNQYFATALGTRAIVSVQDPVRIGERSEPEPDLMLLRPRDDFYADAHPTAADVFLLVEVADTSLAYDRDVKMPLYARSGIPEVWLLDVEGGQLTVYRDPTPEGYQSVQTAQRGETLAPLAFPDIALPVDELLG